MFFLTCRTDWLCGTTDILKNVGNQTVSVPTFYAHTMEVNGNWNWIPTSFKISSFMFHRRKKGTCLHTKDMRLSNWQNYHFWPDYPFRLQCIMTKRKEKKVFGWLCNKNRRVTSLEKATKTSLSALWCQQTTIRAILSKWRVWNSC